MDKTFLKEMIETPSVSGYEIDLQKKVKQYMMNRCDEILSDYTGDVICVANPKADQKVLLCGHIDEIGFVVTRILDNGMLKVTKAGGIHPVLYLGTHVQVVTKNGNIPGVVATNSMLEHKENVEVSDLYIDMGFDTKEACEKNCIYWRFYRCRK